MSAARMFIFGPIPAPETWVMASDAPRGYLKLCSLSITPRARSGSGTDLVLTEDALRGQLQRLLAAFHQIDAAAKDEVVRLAEQLAGAAL
jgi:hypothetical protein